jgi:monoamine oxidase
MDTVDVTIIGAGVSGLTCARHLLAAGLRVKVLEARDRPFGRAYSAPNEPFMAHPPELGAEFIHGASRTFINFLVEQKAGFIDAADEHLFLKNARLVSKDDFWEDLETLSKKLNPRRKRDRSVAEFLEAHGKSAPKEVRQLFRAYVEGFQAADLNLMGEKALALNEQADEANLGGVELFRPHGGYTRLFQAWLANEPTLNDAVQLNCIAKNLEWSEGRATVDYVRAGRRQKLSAKAVVITLPVGVLKNSGGEAALTFTPPLPELQRALECLHMGHVQRITFEFKTRFWEKLSDKPVSFLHTGPGSDFPTWWTQLPARSPYLIAWQGGPRAYELSLLSEDERKERALATLARLTRKSKAFLQGQLVQSFSHAWSQDPFSLGAYSYAGVLDQNPLARLRKPFANTVIFAGEAFTETGPSQGTVHGAMESGLRASKQIAQILQK